MLGLKDLCVLISCGLLFIVQSSHASEIIGGKEVKEHTMRYMALLIEKSPVCGGILIDRKWVLTAAHCDKIKEVWLGVHARNKEEINSRQVLKVKTRVPHPDYNKSTMINDLMLLELKTAAKKTDSVEWYKLGKPVKYPKTNKRCLVAGWGDTRLEFDKPIMSDVLMSVNVNVISRKACNSHKHYKGKYVITSDMICAGSLRNKVTDTCDGDSGGPLLCSRQLVGVTSFGGKVEKKGGGVEVHTCGEEKEVGVYTFLSKNHLKWIKKTMGKSEM